MDRKSIIEGFLVVASTLSFVGLVIFIIMTGLNGLDSNTSLLIGTALGTIGSQYQKIYEYYFGSSQGSKEKQDTINTLSQEIKNQ
jgi:hypothetical protein